MKHSSSSSAPRSQSSLAMSVKPGVEPRCDTTSGSADAQFCSSDSTAAACATARRCSKSKAPLQEPDASEQAYGPDGHRESSPPESAPGCVPIPNQAVESSTFYSESTLTLNFEIGSSHTAHARTFVEVKLLASWCSSPFSLKVAALVKVSNSMRRSKKLERKNGYCRSPLFAWVG